ncbi:carbohydrate ABC transporter permease, partial [Paenibacillus sp. TAF58]
MKGVNQMIVNTNYTKLLKHLLIIAFGLLMLYPVLWLLSSSFKPNQLIFSDTSLWPKKVTFDNYMNGWKGLQGTT